MYHLSLSLPVYLVVIVCFMTTLSGAESLLLALRSNTIPDGLEEPGAVLGIELDQPRERQAHYSIDYFFGLLKIYLKDLWQTIDIYTHFFYFLLIAI